MTSPEFRPDLSCVVCQTPYVVTGDTPIARDRAIRDWSGCCRPNTPNPLAATGPSAVTARATKHRLFSGVPAFVRRRIGVWPFTEDEFTT